MVWFSLRLSSLEGEVVAVETVALVRSWESRGKADHLDCLLAAEL